MSGAAEPDWSIGPVLPVDIPVLLEFWLISAEGAHRPVDDGDAVARLLARDPDALLVARTEWGIVGTLILGWDGWRAHLYRLAVAPNRRRSGIGRALVEAGERRLIELGAIRIDAMVLNDNEAAHRTWSALGYHRQSEWSRWVKPVG